MKRSTEDKQEMKKQDQQSDDDSEKSEDSSLEPGVKRVNMPKKSKYRTRAHINPMGDLNFPVPMNPDYIDWSYHYPAMFGIKDHRGDQKFANTHKYPVPYDKKIEEQKDQPQLVPSIVDIGCGYGGLMFELSKEFKDKLILGMEIRDLVANFVVDKTHSKRINSGHKNYLNVGVVKTNTMKTLHNYFRKESLEKMFFCFADPHFKKQNHRRRIINTTLLSDYAYVLKPGGQIYVITDVKELYDWEVEHLEMHPLFERIPDSEYDKDPCIKFMSQGTDEAKKVLRNEGGMWYAVYRKRDLVNEKQKIDEEVLKYYL